MPNGADISLLLLFWNPAYAEGKSEVIVISETCATCDAFVWVPVSRHRDSLKLNSFGYVQGYGCDYRGISFRREKRAVFSCFEWNAYTTNGGIVKALPPLGFDKSVYGDYTRTLGLTLRILTAAPRDWVSVRTKGCGSLTPVALWLLDGCIHLEDFIVFDWFFPCCDTF